MVVLSTIAAVISIATAAITAVIIIIIISIIVIIWSLVIHNLSFPNICSICCIWILSDIRQYLLYYIENNTQKQYTVHELLMCFLNYF